MRFLLAFIIMIVPLSAEAKRVALVVGNASYQTETPLKNAHADASSLADTLQQLGFEVLHHNDLDRTSFAETLRDFEQMLEGAEVAAFYYAGHGIQYQGQNYLLPTDASLSNHFMFAAETIALSAVVDAMSRSAGISLILVDACRDNPFVDRLRRSLPASRSAVTTRGLARLSSHPSESILVYATQPDEIALDGEGTHSPFAAALLKHLPTPEAEIGLVMRRVIGEVRNLTGGQQSPEVSVSLSAELYLNLDGKLDFSFRPYPKPRPMNKPVEYGDDVNSMLEGMWRDGLELSRQGKIQDYYGIMKEAYDIALEVYGPESHQYAQANNHMAGPLSLLGRKQDAANASREAIRVFEALYGPDDTRVANDKNNLAGRLLQLGQVDEAEKNFLEAKSIYENVRRMGWDHTGYANTLSAYGRFLADAGEPTEGLSLAHQAIEVLESTGRVRDRYYGQVLMTAADLENTFGSCQEAQNLYGLALNAFVVAGIADTHWDVVRSSEMALKECF